MLSTSHPAPKMAFHSLAEHKLFTFEEASRKKLKENTIKDVLVWLYA